LATFKFGRYIDIHWNGYDIQGPADTVFSIPDQLYEEFDADIAPVEPTLQWIDTNEFQTLSASVSASTLSATAPITIASTSTGRIISFSSGTALNGYLLSADGAGGAIWNPASTSGLTSVVGISPVSAAVSGGVVSVSLAANYQTAGTYVTGVVGTSPISATGTTSITISVDQTAITANSATNAEVLRTYVKNSSGSTITKGSAVYVTGADGTNALIGLACATSDAASSKTLGILASTLTNNAFGYVIENGTLAGIDTSSATAGSSIWLGTTPGSLVFGAPPAEPNHSVYLGVVTKANPSTGEILVKVQNGYELDELHDVSAASPSDGDIIQYKSSSDMWTKSSIAGAGIAASSHTHDYQVSGNYQTAGTYVNAVIGMSPASVSTSSGTATVSIVASSIDSSHLANNAVVAAKIAANAVGVVAISSGTASNSTVLTADGSGGASFLPFTSGASFYVDQPYWSGVLINTNSSSVVIGAATATTIDGELGVFCFDETSGNSFQIASRNCIVKSTISSGVVVSQTYYTALTANEQFTGIAVNTGSTRNVLAISSSISSTTTQVSKYYVIDPSAMTVKNSGNLAGATGTLHFRSNPKVRFDPALGEFTIRLSVYTGALTTGAYRGILRTVHPTTYATRVHTFPSGESIPQEDSIGTGTGSKGCNVIYIAQHTGWLHARGNSNFDSLQFYSDNGASSQFLTATSSRTLASTDLVSSMIQFAPLMSSTQTTIYFESRDTTSNSTTESLDIGKVSLSDISSGFSSVGISSFTSATIFKATNASPSVAAWNTAFSSFGTWDINGTIYVGNPYACIVEDPMFANSYSDRFWVGPGSTQGTGYGVVYSDNGTARFAINSTANTTASTFPSIKTYNFGTWLSIDFVSATSSTVMMIAPNQESTSPVGGANYKQPVSNGSFVGSAGIFSNIVTSPNTVSLLKAGHTYTYRWGPRVNTSDITATLPTNWVLK